MTTDLALKYLKLVKTYPYLIWLKSISAMWINWILARPSFISGRQQGGTGDGDLAKTARLVGCEYHILDHSSMYVCVCIHDSMRADIIIYP